MLLVDRRTGSKELAPGLSRAGMDVEGYPDELPTLEFGDIAFAGRGEKGTVLDIGIERKTIHDLVSSLRTGRLAGHQLPGLRKTYDHTWLLVEGLWSANKIGLVCTFAGKHRGWVPVPGRMHASELDKQLTTLELLGGLRVRQTVGVRDTVRFVCSLYRWFTDKAFDEHKSHLVTHDTPTLIPLSDFRAAVCKWPSVGVEWSAAVEKIFGSPAYAATAQVDEWAALSRIDKRGKVFHFGTKNAQRVVAFLRGETSGH